MTPDDAERFVELMAGIGETYNQSVSPMRSTVYFGALQDYDFHVVNAAFMRHVQTSKFFPTPADIREIVEGSDTDKEGIAWNALTEAIRRVGPYQSLIVEDPVIASAICVAFGSWIGACETRQNLHEAQWHARRKDFGAAVRTARRSPQIRNGGPRLLTGYCDGENRANRANWAEGKKLTHQLYGVLTVDGRVESKRLEVDEKTLLPSTSLKTVLLLPSGGDMPLLGGEVAAESDAPVDPEFLELTPEQAAARFREKFAEMIEKKGLRKSDRRDGETQEQFEDRRRAEIRAHAESEDSQVHAAGAAPGDTDTVPDSAQGEARRIVDRGSDEGGRPADATDGVSVRDVDRTKVETGLRVAGVHDRAGDRGRGVRQRDPRGNRSVDEARGKDRKPAAEHSRPRRRQA